MSKLPKETGRLRKIIEAFPRITVTVLGDMVADEFVFGEISRVSREAPVLVLRHLDRTVIPGGGANAVNSLAVREYLRASDALLVSDYGYGAATPEILNAALNKGGPDSMPVVLDSRHRMLKFSGVTAATPNQPEVEEALGVQMGPEWDNLCSAGTEIIFRMKLKSLVITRGRDGMVAFSAKHKPVDIPTFGSDEVADVTGAGDTVIATYAVALAAGATAEEAAHLAN